MSLRRKLVTASLALSIAIGGSQALANQELFAELEQAAQSVRQLELLEPLDVEVVTREEHREAQAQDIEDEVNAEGAEDWNSLLIFLGFIGEDEDINEIYSGFISEQVLGTYDPATKQLVVISTNTDEWGATDKTTFVHETVHALQDQNFDIMSVYGDEQTLTDDRFYASRSLIEGDASMAEVIYIVENDLLDQILEEYESSELPSTDDIPFFLMETMTFYYDEGAMFVMNIWQEGGWDAVNAAWENPPTTSEQIIHPEKYAEGEGAIPVAIGDPQPLFGDDWRIIEDNEWGELGTRVFLENGGASSNAASDAAEGWGGDGVYVITNDEETAMVWTSAWDSEDEASEFVETLVDAESTRLDLESEPADETLTILSGDGWIGEIHRDGEVVTYYLTETEQSMDQMIQSQVGAEVRPDSTPVQEATPATPENSVAFWIRES